MHIYMWQITDIHDKDISPLLIVPLRRVNKNKMVEVDGKKNEKSSMLINAMLAACGIWIDCTADAFVDGSQKRGWNVQDEQKLRTHRLAIELK